MNQMFKNLNLLKQDMVQKSWTIDSFNFNYNGYKYIVLVKLFSRGTDDSIQEMPKYASVKLEFLRYDDFSNSLSVFANSYKIDWNVKQFREFFGIQYGPNLGDIVQQFNNHFAKFIPTFVIQGKSTFEKLAMVYGLDGGNSKDPLRCYCYAVKRNPKGEKRSIYNDNKTKILREPLYNRLKSDDSLSFVYSMNESDEKNDSEIILNWTTNNKRKTT
ncbi:DUF6037 family protein [Leuconostoc mesenteroides]|uniref:DUF6037 family protein n=1 Tax=Leuconostoc mesenteroides TaxID=1245 RepID=UPI00235E03D5|nr:DUF6037 family protein [Leuconostoc mesenteroides]